MTTRDGIVLALAGVVSGGDFTVPPYPAVALRLQRMLASDRHSLSDVADVVATDAALAATVLAVANSAMLSVSAPITNLSRAVSRIGARTVGAIALATSVSSAAVCAGQLLDVKFNVWCRSMTCALVCQELAAPRGLQSDEAFLSGLLHGFGRSIAVTCIEQLLRSERGSTTLKAEEWLEIAEEQRASLARAIAHAWQLPPAIADAIDDKARGVSALNDLVMDADAIAGELIAGRQPTAPSSQEGALLEALLARLPGALDAFSPASSAAGKLVTSASSAVTKPDHALTGELRAATLGVADRRAKCAPTLTCLTLGSSGIEVQSSMRYQECAVVRLAIGEAETKLEPWFTVALCVAEVSRFRVEFQLFSPTREVREQWLALYESAEHDASATYQRVASVASELLAQAPTGSTGKR